MSWQDVANGLFELFGAAANFANVRRLLKDKEVRGVDWRATAFFTVWGLWNLYYYPFLNQWMSFVGGLAIVVVNGLWVALALYYIWRKK